MVSTPLVEDSAMMALDNVKPLFFDEQNLEFLCVNLETLQLSLKTLMLLKEGFEGKKKE